MKLELHLYPELFRKADTAFKKGDRVVICDGHDDFPKSLQGQKGTIDTVEAVKLSGHVDVTYMVIPDEPVPESRFDDGAWYLGEAYLRPLEE